MEDLTEKTVVVFARPFTVLAVGLADSRANFWKLPTSCCGETSSPRLP